MENIRFKKMIDKANCSTVIIGKNASATGKVLMGHNEDDTDAIVQLHVVPRVKYKPGDVITFADGKAVIPQPEESYAYYWSEVRCPGGISFADCAVNEYGVALVTNACGPSKDDKQKPGEIAFTNNTEDYGLGYAIRRLVPERAKTAREAVQVIAELVEKYGYISARSYQVADKDEAWAVQIPKGFNVAARRIGDDEVYYMSNWFTIHEIDFEDKENYYASPNLVQHAIDRGWYTPAVEGDWSDFDFAKAYQYADMMWNPPRSRTAWKLLTGVDLPADGLKPFTMKATKKYTVADVKRVITSHNEGLVDDLSDNCAIHPHRYPTSTICNESTIESSVIEFNEDINLTRVLRAFPKGCLMPYVPFYPVAMTKAPEGYEWMNWQAAQVSHFFVDDEEFEYDPAKAWWAFRTVQFLTEFDYKNTAPDVRMAKAELEAKWEQEKEAVEKAYAAMKATGEIQAKKVLADTTDRYAKEAWKWANKMIRTIGEAKIRQNVNVWVEKVGVPDSLFEYYVE